MNRLCIAVLAGLLAVFTAVPALAQTPEQDRGFLVGLLEDSLSGIGREVRIDGFAGALSARATIDQLTIADGDGVWFTLNGAVLDWDRGALLRGRLQIAELSATEVTISRRPTRDPALPAPEAAGFSLPVLPGSVEIGRLAISRLSLGEPLFGQAAVVTFAGSIRLAEGSGETELAINRIDGSAGNLALSGGYTNSIRHLALSLQLDEAADGIVANLLDLPGLPSVRLSLVGAAPIDDFAAEITLATDGQQRLAGQIALAARPETDTPDAPVTRVFSAELGGDLAPIFLPDYQSFFGPDVRLTLSGRRHSDGQVQIDTLDLDAQAISARARLLLGPDGWPANLDISAKIATRDGDPVLLPLSGPQQFVTSAAVELKYDADQGDDWSAHVTLIGLRQQGLQLQNAQLTGNGNLTRGDGDAIGRVVGAVDLLANGIAFADRAAAGAIGDTLAGKIKFDWVEDAPLNLSDFSFSGSDYGLQGGAIISGLQNRLNLLASGAVALQASDLSRFAALAGMDISGSARLNIAGSSAFLAGEFDLEMAGSTSDLRFGQPILDPLLQGPGEIALAVVRDAAGTHLPRLDIATSGLRASAAVDLKTGATVADFDLALPELAVLDVGLTGASSLRGQARQSGAQWQFDVSAAGPGGARATMAGTAIGEAPQSLALDGTLRATIPSLTPYSRLVGRKLVGAAEMVVAGRYETAAGSFSSQVDLSGTDLAVGQSHLDQLLAGQSKLQIQARRETPDLIVFDQIDVTTPQVTADITGSVGPARSRLRFFALMRDFALFAPDLSGPLTAEGVIEKSGPDWQVEAAGLGRGGTTLQATGSISADASQLDLHLLGAAPLALANRYIKPRSVSGLANFDLRLVGSPAIGSLSGAVNTAAASITLPDQRMALVDISARSDIAGGRAALDATSRVSSGGSAGLRGSMALTAPFPADLGLSIRQAAIARPRVFETTVDGDVTINGPLTGGARIAGALTLGTVDVSVPEAGPATATILPDLRHANEPVSVHRTREFANLIGGPGGDGVSGPPFPVDIILRAPSRIFVRGRGLDAELGGALRLLGSTAALIPQGQFDLIRGRLDILGKRLTITEGYARLQGSFDPYLRLVAETTAEGVRISIVVEGLASAPTVSFQSSPELPEDEVLSLLLFGRGITKISAFQAAQLASAINTLVGRGGGGIVNRLRDRFGLDDLDVVTAEDGAVGARVGKYITENIYSDITVDSEGKSQINLNIQISPSITARGKLDSGGDTGLGLFIEKDY